jgi:type IV pilus assembly protein PilM
MRASLPYQVRDMLPLPMENSLLDFHPLEDPGTAKEVRGLLIAAPKDAVAAAVGATERAGLHVSRVDLASFALLRATSRLDDQVEAIVDIGAQATTVVVHVNGEPLIVRTVPRGGHEITEMLAGRLGVDLSGSEALKRRVGLSQEDEPETAEMIRELVRPLIREVRGSFTYLTARDQPRQVNRLVLSGGGSHLIGLAAAMKATLDVEVVPAEPLLRIHDTRRSINGALRGAGASATVAIGLSLGASR